MNNPSAHSLHVIGITGIGEIDSSTNLAETILLAVNNQRIALKSMDILVVTQKIVSKAEGRIVNLSEFDPSAKALKLASDTGRDPQLVEAILSESKSVIRVDRSRGIIISETHHGLICANSGIDTSNVPGENMVSLLPKHPDRSASNIMKFLKDQLGIHLGVIISDTHGRAWRQGATNLAIGVAGLEPITDYRGTTDAFGEILNTTTIATADEIAASAELVMRKTSLIPVAIVRGVEFSESTGSSEGLIRDAQSDLFR